MYFTDLEIWHVIFRIIPVNLPHTSGQSNSKMAKVLLKTNMLAGGTKELPKHRQVFCSGVS